MAASLIPLIAARWMMSDASRLILNPIPGLGVGTPKMPGAMMQPGPTVRMEVKLPFLSNMADPLYQIPSSMKDPLYRIPSSMPLSRLGPRNAVMNAAVLERPKTEHGGGSPPPPNEPPDNGRPGGNWGSGGDDSEYLKRVPESDVRGILKGWIEHTKVLHMAGQFGQQGLAETYAESLRELKGHLSFSQDTNSAIMKSRELYMAMYTPDGKHVLALAGGSLVKTSATSWTFDVKHISLNPHELCEEDSVAEGLIIKGLYLLAEDVHMELKLDEKFVVNAAGPGDPVLKRTRGCEHPPSPPDDSQPGTDGSKDASTFLHRVSGSDVVGLIEEWIGHTGVLRMTGQFGNDALAGMYAKSLDELQGLRSFCQDKEKSHVTDLQNMVFAMYSADKKTILGIAAGSLVKHPISGWVYVIKHIAVSPSDLAESSDAELQMRKGLIFLAEDIGVELSLTAALERPLPQDDGGSPSHLDDRQPGGAIDAGGEPFLVRVAGSEVEGLLDDWVDHMKVLVMTGQFGNDALSEMYAKSLEELELLRSFSPSVENRHVKDGAGMIVAMYSGDGKNILAVAAGSMIRFHGQGWTFVLKYIAVKPAEPCAVELQMRAGLHRLAEDAGMKLESREATPTACIIDTD